MERLDDSFRFVTSEAMIPSQQIDKDLFDSFMVLNETRDAANIYQDRKEWCGFASGLFVQRNYYVNGNKLLNEYVLEKLKLLRDSKTDAIQNITLQLPVHPGAGTTTLLHNVAFNCAKEGFPSFVLKQDASSFSLGQLSSVLTDLSHRARNIHKNSGSMHSTVGSFFPECSSDFEEEVI